MFKVHHYRLQDTYTELAPMPGYDHAHASDEDGQHGGDNHSHLEDGSNGRTYAEEWNPARGFQDYDYTIRTLMEGGGLTQSQAENWWRSHYEEDGGGVSGTVLAEYMAEIQASNDVNFWRELTAQGFADQSRYARMQADQAERMTDMAEDQYNYYTETFRPREEAFVADVFEGVPIEAFVETAGADVRKTFNQAQDATARRMESMGIDPTSPRYAAALGDLDIARAAAEAGARTTARDQARNLDYSRRAAALQMGRGLVSEATQAGAAGLGGLQGAAGTSARGYGIQTEGIQGILGLHENDVNRQHEANMVGMQMAGAMDPILGGAAQGASAALMAAAMGCWVAREVYGEDNPKWQRFRYWLENLGPKWFKKLYIKYGPDFAKWIRNKPVLKRVIRAWMDSRIARISVYDLGALEGA